MTFESYDTETFYDEMFLPDQTTGILDVKYFLLLPSADDVGRPIDDLQ